MKGKMRIRRYGVEWWVVHYVDGPLGRDIFVGDYEAWTIAMFVAEWYAKNVAPAG